MKNETFRIAVIGGGVAGVVASWLLSQQHDVVLFEKNDYVGGHTRTVLIPHGPDEGTAVDTGFIVCNDKTYPTFHRFLESLGVPWRWSDMSFGFHDESTGLQYAGTNLNGLFAQRRNLFRPAYLRMLTEIVRFSRQALSDLTGENLPPGLTLGNYLKQHRFGGFFTRNYLLPMGAAIWSTRAAKMLDFPAATLVCFFKNHGLLSLRDRPRWQTVVGGSHSYVKAFLQSFPGEVRLRANLQSIRRYDSQVTLRHADGHEEHFDHVVIATHADDALRLLQDPSQEESRLLGAWEYENNRVVLHTDPVVMPSNSRAWASWNYTRERTAEPDGALSMTYHMNRLQGLQSSNQYFVTLNRNQPVGEKSVIREIIFKHPLYTSRSIASQKDLVRLNGRNRTWFCGSYFGYGFHEDAVASAARVGAGFGMFFSTPHSTAPRQPSHSDVVTPTKQDPTPDREEIHG